MKVLIADDDAMWRTMLERHVFNWGFEPIVVEDGKQALAVLLDSQAPRLAILDWQMPLMDGIDVCRKVKRSEDLPFTYVMMLTSRDGQDDIVTGLDAGADDYLTKPIKPAVLRSRLAAARRIVELVPPKDWTAPPIPGYRVQRMLGKGAFATIWHGENEATGQVAAVKVIRVDLATDEVFERFAQEIKIMQRMDHPTIARIYDSHIDRTLGYYAMELVEGVTLDVYVKQQRPKPTKFLKMIAEVCDALHYAHELGVIHRDLKPSNILVTRDEQPKLVDFGLAKTMFRFGLESEPGEKAGADAAPRGDVIGTPLFMAPEQARGEESRQDGRTDVYALAIVVYLMLLRQHPHDITHGDRLATIRSIAQGYVRPPSEIHPKFNPELEEIIMKALSANPNKRYASAAAFAIALRGFLDRRASSSSETLARRAGNVRHPQKGQPDEDR